MPDKTVFREDHYNYVVHLADNVLILGQRLGEWCGHGPVLEQDIALTNIALDLIGQSRLLYQYAAGMKDDGSDEDTLALLRKPQDYRNFLLVEQPNGNFGDTMMRQFLFDAFNHANYTALANSADEHLRSIAHRAIKEVSYHVRFSSEWIIRLGDGTAESHQKMQAAADNLWMYTGELCLPYPGEKSLVDEGIVPDSTALKQAWLERVDHVMTSATLTIPKVDWMLTGGKDGRHTEHIGYILTELQYMQRTYPGVKW